MSEIVDLVLALALLATVMTLLANQRHCEEIRRLQLDFNEAVAAALKKAANRATSASVPGAGSAAASGAVPRVARPDVDQTSARLGPDGPGDPPPAS